MKTKIICIIDKSGSMNKIKTDAIGGFNSFIEEQRKIQDDTTMSVILFDSKYNMIQESTDLDTITLLDESNYIPSGMTALYDSIGFSIEKTMESLKNETEDNKTERVLVIILTDGEENRSVEYTRQAIFNMIEDRRKNDWEFMFLAANQDAMVAAGGIAIPTGNAMQFTADVEGISRSYSKISSVTSKYRMSKTKFSSNLMDDNEPLNVDNK